MPGEHHKWGGHTITGKAIDGFAGRVLLSSIDLYLKHGIPPTRGVGPAQMREMATRFTGRKYARSRKGLEKAQADLQRLAEGKTLDELGETKAVNKEVGGEAADLGPQPCPLCKKEAVIPITDLPPKWQKKIDTSDGTTHICNPLIGGCDTGFKAG